MVTVAMAMTSTAAESTTVFNSDVFSGSGRGSVPVYRRCFVLAACLVVAVSCFGVK